MAITATFAKLNETEFADTVRATATELLETTQVKLTQVQEEARTRLSKGVLASAEYANQVSQYLAELALTIAPPAPVKRRAAAKPAAKKAAAKPRATARKSRAA